MTLLQLKYIVKIVECGSMNEASHELYVSQPALSSSVKELEHELGIEIFTRSSQGIALTVDGAEFLTYARQVLDQASLLEERYKNAKPRKQLCSVSTQHYMFAVEAFVEMINSIKSDEYEFTIRETRTKDIINQVANMQSEIGILYLSDFNKNVINKLLREKHLVFHPLFRANLHVFISRNNPLAGKKKVTMEDLKPFPFIQYEQGAEGSFYFAGRRSSISSSASTGTPCARASTTVISTMRKSSLCRWTRTRRCCSGGSPTSGRNCRPRRRPIWTSYAR